MFFLLIFIFFGFYRVQKFYEPPIGSFDSYGGKKLKSADLRGERRGSKIVRREGRAKNLENDLAKKAIFGKNS